MYLSTFYKTEYLTSIGFYCRYLSTWSTVLDLKPDPQYFQIFVTGKYKYTDSFHVDITESGMANSRGCRMEQRLVLFYKIVNKIASIQTDSILAPADG